jgi:hypothetical protein
MISLKEHIFEKLNITENTVELPDLEEFKTAIYNFRTGHNIIFEEIDPKYKELKNCPKYKLPGNTVYYSTSLYVSKRMNKDKILFAECYENASSLELNHVMINSLDTLINVLGEELILQIWDYIK